MFFGHFDNLSMLVKRFKRLNLHARISSKCSLVNTLPHGLDGLLMRMAAVLSLINDSRCARLHSHDFSGYHIYIIISLYKLTEIWETASFRTYLPISHNTGTRCLLIRPRLHRERSPGEGVKYSGLRLPIHQYSYPMPQSNHTTTPHPKITWDMGRWQEA